MKFKLALFAFITFRVITVFSQKTDINYIYSNQTSNIIFVGVVNPVTIHLGNSELDYSFYSNDADLKHKYRTDLIYLTTRKIGKIEVFYVKLCESDTLSIDTFIFESIVPNPIVTFPIDTISLNEMDGIDSISIFSVKFIPWIECKMEFYFDLIHVRGDSSLIRFYNNLSSSMLNKEMINNLKSTYKHGDKIMIVNFSSILWGTHKVQLPSKQIILI